MSISDLLLALDQGTTSSRAIAFRLNGEVVATAQQEFTQYFPHEGWVEHDGEEIWQTTLATAREVIAAVGIERIAAIGITNQRETSLLWEPASGTALARAIVWQDRRTAGLTDRLKTEGHEALIRERTGLLLDPYFSASKFAWLLDNTEGARAAAGSGRAVLGTVDSFLISRLTGGRMHITDATNAARTSLYNIHQGTWDQDLLDLFTIPAAALPAVVDSAGTLAETEASLFGRPVPICGIAGDQQAAAIGQGCLTPGSIKSTYGTGCFVLMNTGTAAPLSDHKLLTTVAWQIGGERRYALEGSIFVAGAAIQWLRDGLGIIQSAAESETLARSMEDTGGVYMVPAFTGLGAPHWAPEARGLITGLTRDSGPAVITRAALESVAYQTADLVDAFAADGAPPAVLRIDGGMVANDWFAQYLADIVNLTVDRPVVQETTALGAAWLAALGAGLIPSLEALDHYWRLDRRFEAQMDADRRDRRRTGWNQAVRRTLAP